MKKIRIAAMLAAVLFMIGAFPIGSLAYNEEIETEISDESAFSAAEDVTEETFDSFDSAEIEAAEEITETAAQETDTAEAEDETEAPYVTEAEDGVSDETAGQQEFPALEAASEEEIHFLELQEGFSAAPQESGFLLAWSPDDRANLYEVSVLDRDGNAIAVETTGDTSYAVTGLVSGQTFSFRVRLRNAENAWEDYLESGQILFLASPAVTADGCAEGVRISWAAVDGAARYRVYYREAGVGHYQHAGYTENTNYTFSNFTDGTRYDIAVRAVAADGSMGWYVPVICTKLATITAGAEANAAGIRISWTAAEGAGKYRVYYREAGVGSYRTAGYTEGTDYTFTNLADGRQYQFAVRAVAADGSMGWYKPVKYTKLAATAANAEGSASGIRLSWTSAEGAAQYRVYYREAGHGSYRTARYTTGTEYSFTDLTNGTQYQFAVRAVASDGSMGWYVPVKATKLASPTVAADGSAAGLRISWGAVTGAARYRVYYREAGVGSYRTAGYTEGTDNTFTNLANGTQYQFAVRAVAADGCMGWYKAVKATMLASPAITAEANASGIRISWGTVTGAVKYRVYYREVGSGSYRTAGYTTGTNYTFTNLTNGRQYQFAVRAISSSGNMGWYTPVKYTKLASPAVTAQRNGNGIRISWGAVSGAAKYRVYYREVGSGSYRTAGYTTGRSYTFTNLTEGRQYQFAVRAIASDGSMGWYKPVKQSYAQFVVCIDPGHQTRSHTARIPRGPGSTETNIGVTVGTHSLTTGKMEYELNLEIALQLRDRLEEAGIDVVMTRTTNNVDITNDQRAIIANEAGADISIHIHADGVDNTSVRGSHCIIIGKHNPYIPSIYAGSMRLSRCLIDNYLEATSFRGFKVRSGTSNGIVEDDDYPMLNFSEIPTCIFEMGFMSNAEEDKWMSDPDFQEIMVTGMFNGIMEYFGLN